MIDEQPKVCSTCRFWVGVTNGFGECIAPERLAPMLTGPAATCENWQNRFDNDATPLVG